MMRFWILQVYCWVC